jgi:cytochrome c oxidase cbb3-type subunit 4
VDINTLRSIVTVLSFSAFVGIVLWAYSGGARRKFEEAARLPFAEDEVVNDLRREAQP